MKVCSALLLLFGLSSALSATVYRSDLPVSEVRQRLADAPRQEFVTITEMPMNLKEATAAADALAEAKVWRASGAEASLISPIRWTGYPRSFSFHLNSWVPVVPFYVAAGQGAERRYFDDGYQIALDWMKSQIPPIRGIETTGAMDATIGQKEEFVWYDMGVGLRIYPLAWTLARIAQDPAYPDEEVKLFVDGLYFHMEALGRPSFFKAHNNHGFFQAVGQLMAARQVPGLPKMDEYAAQALQRLEKIVKEQFTATWVHKEHSPGYHENLLRTFLALRTMGLPESPKLLHGIAGMEEALSWMYTPDFRLVGFGDTSTDGESSSEKLVELLRNDHLIYQASKGQRGKLPPSGVKTFIDAGYVFARFIPEDGDFRRASYLAQTAAFHSRTHKHADHASFVWYERGLPILVDPGRFGYVGRTERGSELWKKGFWYSDPRRMFVESTRAHNTVEIDGEDYPRVGVEPFGSFLKSGEEQGGLVVTESDGVYTKAKTQRHRRVLVFKPGEFLIVMDHLHDEVPHVYTQRFTFDPRWEAKLEGLQVRATAEDAPPLIVQSLLAGATPIAVARGQEKPRMQGWHSDRGLSLIPASSIGFERRATGTGCFVTLFVFGEQLECDLDAQKMDAGMEELTVKWTVDGVEREVAISAHEGKPVKAALVRQARQR